MTIRERYTKALRFEPVDRMPMMEWAIWWDETIERWQAQGLVIPEEPPLKQGEALQRYFGLDLHIQHWIPLLSKETPKPAFHGAAIVDGEAAYERILPTLFREDLLDMERLLTMEAYQRRGEAVTWITLEGFFWGPRTLLGIEPHLFAFYDEPALMHRICQDIADYHLRVLDRLFSVHIPDFMTFAEDMSYNNGPMISEALFDEFMLPYYRQVIPALKEKGVRVLVDSDGDITRAVPWFQRAGIEGILPLERQAGVDIGRLREAYPNFLFIGHYDKMCMPHGEAAMRAEFERLLPTMAKGGFIASVDHQTPPGVTLEQYRVFLSLFREYAMRTEIF